MQRRSAVALQERSQGPAVFVRRPNYLEEMNEKLVNAHAFLGGLD